MTKIVASILASSTEQMIRLMKEATDGADLIELRVDGIHSMSPKELKLLKAAATEPLILTCRSSGEGGLFRGSEKERLDILRSAMELSFDYVDVELSSLEEGFEVGNSDSKLIVSCHEFDKLPEDLPSLVERGIQIGADVIKLAVKVGSLADAFQLADAGEAARRNGVSFVPIAMGPAGVAARILATRFQSKLTYASVSGGPVTGPGQLGLEELLTKYRFRTIGANTEIYGVLGCPVTESLSPVMHNAWIAERGLDATYVPFEETDIQQFVDGAKMLGVRGLSVTRPHKEAILPFLDEIVPEAQKIGAVNTVAVRNDKWIGFNTDVQGVVFPIAKRTPIDGKRAVIVGSGGAARAAAYGLTQRGAKVSVLGRNKDKAMELAEEVRADGGHLDEFEHFDWDILINATPVGGGADHDNTPVPVDRVKPGAVVLDMVYDPEWTPLLLQSRSHGARVISGLEMLTVQAVHQAEVWTGEKPAPEELEEAARAEIEKRKS